MEICSCTNNWDLSFDPLSESRRSLIDGQAYYAWPFTFSVFTPKQVSGPRIAKSQPIWIKFCTHLLLYRIHLWTHLDRDRRMGGSRPNQNDYVFVILVTNPKSYRDDGSPRFRRQTVRVVVRTCTIVKNSRIVALV